MTQQDHHRSHDPEHDHDDDGRAEVRQGGEPLAEPDHRYTEDDQVQPEDATYTESDPDNPLSLQSTRDDETRSQPGG
jgi:hypothetical protein